MFGVSIDRQSKLPLIRQIYQQIRKRILEGNLQAGDRLPSTRELADNLKVSRNVVIEAYDLLFTEGFVTTKHGKGTFVEIGAVLSVRTSKDEIISSNKVLNYNKETVSSNKNFINFKPGIPDLHFFPRSKWLQYYNDVIKNCSTDYLGYQSPEGIQELRQSISDFLYRTRGIECEADRIIITTGAAQGLSIISKLFHSNDKTMGIENPSSNDIYDIFHQQDYQINLLAVDDLGLNTHNLPANLKLIYTTPSHQFPIGGLLPIQRRIELITYAREKHCYIIEDDYDSEFRYTSAPVCSMFELDPQHVIYLGTFSKNLSPALRIGYMILPSDLIETCKQLKWYMDLHSPSLSQLALAKFIENRDLESHIRKMSKLYKKKHQTLLTSLKEVFPSIKLFGTSTGLHVSVEFPINYEDHFIDQLKKEKVMIYPVKQYIKAENDHINKWIIGFGHLSIKEIQTGVDRLSKVFNEHYN